MVFITVTGDNIPLGDSTPNNYQKRVIIACDCSVTQNSVSVCRIVCTFKIQNTPLTPQRSFSDRITQTFAVCSQQTVAQ